MDVCVCVMCLLARYIYTALILLSENMFIPHHDHSCHNRRCGSLLFAIIMYMFSMDKWCAT